MSEYKVIQDIEAEDKLLGPLSMRQFIYAVVVVVQGFIAFRLATVSIFFVIPFLPTMLFFGLLAAPFGQNQSSEVWLLGKIRYIVFSKKRIWDQSGVEHLVTITAPKKIEKNYSDGLSKTEVKSRLKALAATMDTHGWVVKDLAYDPFSTAAKSGDSDRLMQIQKSSVPDDSTAVKPAEDVLDSSSSNPVAQQMSSMVDESEQDHRQKLLSKMQDLAVKQRTAVAPNQTSSAKTITQAPTAKQASKPVSKPGAKPIPATNQPPANTVASNQPIPQQKTNPTPVTQAPSPDILKRVSNRDEKPANKESDNLSEKNADGEVVVSFH